MRNRGARAGGRRNLFARIVADSRQCLIILKDVDCTVVDACCLLKGEKYFFLLLIVLSLWKFRQKYEK